MENFEIRKATADDCEAVADLSSQLNRQQGMTEWHRPLVDVLRDNLDWTDIYLAEADDQAIGFVAGFTQFNPHNSYFRFQVTSIFVDEAFRRQGVGGALLKKIILEKQNETYWTSGSEDKKMFGKIQQFSIDVLPASKDACALYESLGFEKKNPAFVNYRLGWEQLEDFNKKAA